MKNLWGLLLAGACFSVAGIPANCQSSQLKTLNDLVGTALERNRDYLAARQRLNEAQGLLRQAGVRLAPTLEVSGATGRPLGTRGEEEYTAGYFQPIETAGKRSKRVSVAELGVSLGQAEVDERRRQLVFDVKTKYAQAMAAARKQTTLEQLLKVNRSSYEVTKARVEQGDAAPLEGQLLAAELSRVEAQQASFTGRAEATLLDLRRSVGLVPNDKLALSDKVPVAPQDQELDEWQRRALAKRPDLRAARLSEQQGESEISLARAEGVPDVTASARYAHRNTQLDDQYGFTPSGARTLLRDRDDVLSFGVSVPLFTKRRNQGNIEAAVSRQSAARLRREFIESAIPAEVEAAYRRFVAARRALDLFERGAVAQSERNLDVVRQAYTLGQLRILDVLNEQRIVIDTELAFVDAQTEFAEAYAELERTTGEDLP